MGALHPFQRRSRKVGLFVIMLLLSSCATRPHSTVGPGLALPAEVTMNKDAGRGALLLVTLRLEDGQRLPFIVDTGSPMTLLERSLEPKLGERLGTETLVNFGRTYEGSCYSAPRLHLGNTPLATDCNVLTSDFVRKLSSGSDRPIMGILGMDCLQHYCIQLDFKAGKIRFLDPDRLARASLGKAFALTLSSEAQSYPRWVRPCIRHPGLAGGDDVNLLIDTGHDCDGALGTELFRRMIREDTLHVKADANDPDFAYLATCVWDGDCYTDLTLRSREDLLGLRFLARHLVTLDFPSRMIYLKRISGDPLIDKDMAAAAGRVADSAFKPLRRWMKGGQLPGWSKRDRGTFKERVHVRWDPETVTFDVLKKGDSSSTYHYELTRASKDEPWRLHRAWRTDRDDHLIQEYPVP